MKRQSPALCGEPSGTREDYDLSLHIGSVFVILFVSASACAFPLVATRVRAFRVPPRFLFFVRHFGTGVLLATAFAHLFPTAFVNLTDPCLGDFWSQDYEPMAGVIALAAVFAVAIIEQVFSPGRHCCAMPVQSFDAGTPLDSMDRPSQSREAGIREASRSQHPPTPLYGRTKLGRTDSTGQHLARMTSQSAHMDRIERVREEDSLSAARKGSTGSDIEAPPKLPDLEAPGDRELAPDKKREKLLLQCVLLEVGILFHSVFIGMALAVAIGSDFIVLLIAIIFHQTFEGLALGSRIAAVGWSKDEASGWRRWQPWLMALAYGCTTPVGQALGIATHTLYHPDSMTGLLMVGIMSESHPCSWDKVPF